MMHIGTPDESPTFVQRRKLYEDRWSAYGDHPGLINISDKPTPAELKQYKLFKGYDDDFLESLTMDISIAQWEGDRMLFEEGTYLDVAFFIAEGEVDVFLERQQGAPARPIFDAARTFIDLNPNPTDPPTDATSFQTVYRTQLEAHKPAAQQGNGGITYLSSMDFDLPHGETRRLGPGDIFGEIGALNGWPQSATARTASACTLVQIRVPALRKMKLKSAVFKQWVDSVYRARTLLTQLQTAPLFWGCDEPFVASLAERVELVSSAPSEVVTHEGGKADAFYLVRSGFLKLTQRIGEGEAVVTYLSKGMTLGEVELLIDGLDTWQVTASSVGYAELVRVGRRDFVDLVGSYPAVRRQLWEAVVSRVKEAGQARKHLERSELIEFSLETGLVQGNSILVIDLDVCTRCDDCVRGCASTHGGRPRFVREGDKYENFLIARSCYHCEDPVCLIGCPTGAIRRANVAEVVEIDDSLCIGCSNCSNKCPYDAIIMHDTGSTWPDTALPKHLRGRPRKVASKCDLCHTSSAGPACVNNCPHACAFRIGSLEDFQQLLSINPR